jgi:hypothetical protein
MTRSFRSPIPGRPQNKATPITATGPHECVTLTPEQFRGALAYVTRAALSSVQAPKEFFPENTGIQILKSEDAKVTLLAAYAHFKSDPNLSISFFYRYRAMGLVARSSLLRPWVLYDPAHDSFAGFYPSIIHIFGTLPMDRSGNFDPQAVYDAASEICPGFPDYQPPAVEQPLQSVAPPVDHRVAA